MNTKKSNSDEYPHTKLQTKTRPDWTDDATQNFSELQYKCWTKGILFEDPEFPANESSLGVQNISHPIRWRRPVDIVDKPEFFSGDLSTFDVQPGDYGNRPLLCAVASLALHSNLFKLVVPENQNFYIRYAGIFRFKFWKYDRWVDVVIDDRLPSYNGQLVFLHSSGYREFWSALLEKAYAKLHGSYGALRDSYATSVLTDLTGGVSEIYQFSVTPNNDDYIKWLLHKLVDAHKQNSIIICDAPALSRDSTSGKKISSRDGFYCMTKISVEDDNVAINSPSLYLKNPWRYGDGLMNARWTKSGLWLPVHCGPNDEQIMSDVRDTWISVKDLPRYCMQIEICHLPAYMQWIKSVLIGKWVREVSAGGCREFFKTFCYNPQYYIEFNRPDEGKKTCTFIVSLTQQRNKHCQFLTIGFYIFRLKNHDIRLDMNFIRENVSAAKSEYTDRPEVTLHVALPPGTYCIIPSTVYPNQEAEFIIKVLSKTPCNLKEINVSYINPFNETIRHRIKYDDCDLKIIKREFFTSSTLLGIRRQTELPWADFPMILNYTIKTVSTEKVPFFPTKAPNEVFTKNAGVAMISALVDAYPGTQLDFIKFADLWNRIKRWRGTFIYFDSHQEGMLGGFKFREALEIIGFRVSNLILEKVVNTYGTFNGQVAFEEFILCALQLYTCIR